jgi:TorA maturation chaperone TorD
VTGIKLGMAVEPDGADPHRVQAYMLLATLMARPPSAELLARLSVLRGDVSPMGDTLSALGAAAAATDAATAEREFNRLFIGLQQGEVVPYASYYITGFLQDRPLIAVRADMARLGITRVPGVAEPEDHVAAMMEIMAGLIDGRFGAAGTAEQQRFFARHIDPWGQHFFEDLERAGSAALYRPVGTFGRLFLEIEREAFAPPWEPPPWEPPP